MMSKAREKLCPKCGEDITDTYEPAVKEDDGSVVLTGDWYCEVCELSLPEENE